MVPTDSSSEEDSDSDLHSDLDNKKVSPEIFKDEQCDDEDSGPPPTTATYFQTKNELADVDITIPTVEEVEPGEMLQKVGEITNIVGNVVIVKGVATEPAGRVPERALDSDTLLVFEDRKVLGYVRSVDIYLVRS